uniref:Uncharacterized protein n=1 Tax=Octopus bimaculoides TaxID=37653 RepID=A0A0L8IB97_OCTBM
MLRNLGIAADQHRATRFAIIWFEITQDVGDGLCGVVQTCVGSWCMMYRM